MNATFDKIDYHKKSIQEMLLMLIHVIPKIDKKEELKQQKDARADSTIGNYVQHP